MTDKNRHPSGSWETWFELVKDEEDLPKPNLDHLSKLTEGVDVWNKWRDENKLKPDLKGANLSNMNLQRYNLIAANFEKARLLSTDLSYSDCYGANFKDAILLEANFENADVRGSCFDGCDLTFVNLKSAIAINTNFSNAFLKCTNVKGANLNYANFENSDVRQIKFDRNTSYFGIRVSSSYGSPRFKRFAQHQDFIEEFKSLSKWKLLYWPWLIFMDCGRIRW